MTDVTRIGPLPEHEWNDSARDVFAFWEGEVPDLTIVLDHLGSPHSSGPGADHKGPTFTAWATSMCELARRLNVYVRLGGLGMDLASPMGNAIASTHSAELATRWRPWIEQCIESFTPYRCMFESNFPPDRQAGSYGAIWNAYKVITSGTRSTRKMRCSGEPPQLSIASTCSDGVAQRLCPRGD